MRVFSLEMVFDLAIVDDMAQEKDIEFEEGGWGHLGLWRARVCKGGGRRRKGTGEAVSWSHRGREGPGGWNWERPLAFRQRAVAGTLLRGF